MNLGWPHVAENEWKPSNEWEFYLTSNRHHPCSHGATPTRRDGPLCQQSQRGDDTVMDGVKRGTADIFQGGEGRLCRISKLSVETSRKKRRWAK